MIFKFILYLVVLIICACIYYMCEQRLQRIREKQEKMIITVEWLENLIFLVSMKWFSIILFIIRLYSIGFLLIRLMIGR